MIKFFRNFRKKLLSEGKTGRYLKYAFGEIILVVIGILIALQINNWNTQKNEDKALKGYLNNIAKCIESDMAQTKAMQQFRADMIEVSKNYLALAKQDRILEDDLGQISAIYAVFNDQYLTGNRNGFDALKNSGYLGKIQGRPLETDLYDYYSLVGQIEAQEKSLNDFIEEMEVLAFTDDLPQSWFRLFERPDRETYFEQHPETIKAMMNHPSITGAHLRYSVLTDLPRKYDELMALGSKIIDEIRSTAQEQ